MAYDLAHRKQIQSKNICEVSSKKGQTQNRKKMKTQTQYKFSTAKSLIVMMYISLAIVTSSFSTNNNEGNKKKAENATKTDSVMTEELIDEIYETEELAFDFLEELESPAFQVMNSDDQLIFSGSKKEWENQQNRELIIMKRKAEFLFESNGTKIYKVF